MTVLQLKSEIQVLLSEHKNLNQLMIKASPKQQSQRQHLMQQLQLSTQGKQHAQLVEKFCLNG